jgi:hypothetical protein
MLKQRDQAAISADSMPVTEDAFLPDASEFDDAIPIEAIAEEIPQETESDPIAEASAAAAAWIDKEFKS